MAHNHIVNDTDKHFVIDPVTRAITNQSEKIMLIQGDHNSERFTFEIPRTVEEHDMSLCNRVEIHYCNIKADRTATNADVYVADDVAVEDDLLTFSWLISGNATLYDGTLSFGVKFKCVDYDGTVSYVWKTSVFKGISVGEGYDNAGAVVEEYSDVFAEWEARIAALEQGGGSVSVNRFTEVTLKADGWVGETSPYYQVVPVNTVTPNSKVILDITDEQAEIFSAKDINFTVTNTNGVVTFKTTGRDKPKNDYTVQVTIIEVVRV